MYLIKSVHVAGDKNIGNFKNCFEAISIEFETGRQTVQAPLGGSGRKFGPTKCSPIRIVKEYCKASSVLQEYCTFGKTHDIKIYFLDNNNTEYIEMTLTEALFSNYKFTAHGGKAPHEAFDITYTAINTRHIPRDEKGIPAGNPSSSSYNLTKQKKS